MVAVMSEAARPSHRTLTPALLAVMWLVFFGFASFFMTYATLVTTGESMGLSAVTAGSVLTTMMVAVVAVQPFVPWLNRRIGARLTFTLGLVLQGLGHALPLLPADPLFALLTGSVIGGLGFGILVVIGTAVVPSTISPDRLGRALGFYGATTATATAVSAPLALWLISSLSPPGFRWLNLLVVAIALPAIVLIPTREVTEHTGPHTAGQQHTPASRAVDLPGLAAVLAPTGLVLTVFGLILAFGPADQSVPPAAYIATMQGFVILGRFISSSALDRITPTSVMLFGLVAALISLCFAAVLPGGPWLFVVLAVLGIGTGGVQAASLLLAFRQSGSPQRGSVAWNMTFDIGLGFAGLVGGIGFTYWGAPATYLTCAVALAITTVLFTAVFRRRRPQQ